MFFPDPAQHLTKKASMNFSKSFEELSRQFLNKIFDHLEKANIDLSSWEIDHLCYRTSSYKNYEEMKLEFSQLGELLVEGNVNGRPIATYKLMKPIIYKDKVIPLVEVPAPKMGVETPEGLEHIEVVIDKSFEEFMNIHKDITFHTKALSKKLNPELEIEFEDCAIKFHHQSLEEVIRIEKELGIVD